MINLNKPRSAFSAHEKQVAGNEGFSAYCSVCENHAVMYHEESVWQLKRENEILKDRNKYLESVVNKKGKLKVKLEEIREMIEKEEQFLLEAEHYHCWQSPCRECE